MIATRKCQLPNKHNVDTFKNSETKSTFFSDTASSCLINEKARVEMMGAIIKVPTNFSQRSKIFIYSKYLYTAFSAP